MSFATLTGTQGGSGASLRLGACELSLLVPEQEDEARPPLDNTGSGPLEVGLAVDLPGTRRSWGPAALSWGEHTALAMRRGVTVEAKVVQLAAR